ncbi:MAG TPA: S-adenosylmethionine decarboxylase [Rhabdochlamydiaceae bacterium]|jgi:S-adenosylmethionine/arginine decarboxylase-like enzyme
MCIKSDVSLQGSKILQCTKKKGYWGYHLILDCQGCDITKNVFSRENIQNFIKALVQAIDMKAYGEPLLEHFATHDPTKGGFSLVQLIETSNITGHFVDLNGDAYIDIFSCKPFSSETVQHVVDAYFQPVSIKLHFLTRQA